MVIENSPYDHRIFYYLNNNQSLQKIPQFPVARRGTLQVGQNNRYRETTRAKFEKSQCSANLSSLTVLVYNLELLALEVYLSKSHINQITVLK